MNITLFHFLTSALNGNVEQEKLQKIEYLENKQSFSGKIKSLFHIK